MTATRHDGPGRAAEATGDAEFLRLMTRRRQGAVDVACIEFEPGDEKETRAAAQAIID